MTNLIYSLPVLSLLLPLLTVLVLIAWLAGAGEMIVNGRHVPFLADLPVGTPAELPRATVVVAARNEERGIAEATRSLLAQRYPQLEIIVVDDRSSDATGEILRRLAAENPRLQVITVRSLPAGWLGKNHALALGAGRARGEWILFTDADVHLDPDALARGVSHARQRGLDHLAVAPRLLMRGVLLELFASGFALLFAQVTRPWRARRAGSRFHIGIGAFNLVRAGAYRAVGGHRTIRMRPDDDLRLGRILKEADFRQDLAFGGRDVAVEWYANLGEAMRGLEKNTFAGVDYSLPRALLAGSLLSLLGFYPFAALLFTSGVSWSISMLTAVLIVVIFAGSMRASGGRPFLAAAAPLAVLLVLFIAGRAMVLTLVQGGIRWRDTFYPLEQLREETE
jgi:cellulose synthase/poly-beta-1,6-N-acetylglucosamine synthase-like glycosyltransferase